jgi:hypothetical protein
VRELSDVGVLPGSGGIVDIMFGNLGICDARNIRAGITEYINTIAFGLIVLILYSCDNLDPF